jgi:hypothetical protein
MSLKTTNREVVKEVPWGMLVWQLADGEFAGDDDGNVMHVFTTEDNQAAREALTNAAKHYGVYEGGKCVFWSGKRPITDEELEHQLAREAAGLVPDPLDVGAIREEARALKNNNG